MTLGALIDLGLPVEELQGLLPALGLAGVSLTARRVTKQHLTGVKVEIEAGAPQPARTYREICALIEAAALSEAVKARSLTAFRLLGEVEARIHGQPLETVHFHELGALDTIVDVVGVAHGLEYLGVSRVFCSPLPMGWGMIAAGHGRLPNPAPATLELLQDLPVYGTDLPGELVTPTGAVILKACEAQCEPCPPMTLAAVGYGAGTRDLPGHPNLLRLYLGTPLAAAPGLRETVLVLETHLDDMNPEWYEPLMAGLVAAGALDVALAPIQMKKHRPGSGPHRHRPPGGQGRAAGPVVRRLHHPGGEVHGSGAGHGPALAGDHRDRVRPAAGEGDGVRRPPPGAAGVRGLPPHGRGPGPAPDRGLPPGPPGVTGEGGSGEMSNSLFKS